VAGQFELLFSVDFTSTASITVTHNLDRLQVAVLVRIGDVARNDLITTVTPLDTDPRNAVVVTLDSAQTGAILVVDTDYVFANIPSAENASQPGGDSTREMFTKSSHGLSVGNAVRHAGPNPEDWSAAQADTGDNAEASGVVSIVAGDNFTVTYSGRINGLSGLTAGSTHFLDASSAGALTTTSPTISKPILYATSTTSAVMFPMRGLEDSAPSLVYRIPHTWAISGEIAVPSGDTDFIIPFFVSLASGQTASLVKARHRINSGTSVTCKIQRNGGDVTGFTGISVTTVDTTTDPANVALSDDDDLALVVTAVSASPTNLTFTIFIEISR